MVHQIFLFKQSGIYEGILSVVSEMDWSMHNYMNSIYTATKELTKYEY